MKSCKYAGDCLFLEDFLGGIGSGVSVLTDVEVFEVVLDGKMM